MTQHGEESTRPAAVPAGQGELTNNNDIYTPKWLQSLSGNTLVATVILGLGSALLIAVRLISVAQFNIETSYAILQASGTGAIVVGTVISLIPGISVTIACGSAWLATAYTPDFGTSVALWLATALFTCITVLTTPLKYWPLVVACVLALAAGWTFKERFRKASQPRRKWLAAVIAALFALLLIVGIVQSPPWGPEEDFAFSGQPVVTGYLLGQTDQVTTILIAKPRKIDYYKTATLKNQFACKNVSTFSYSLIHYVPGFNTAPPYPACHPKTKSDH